MHLRVLSILSRNSKTWYLSSAEWCSCFDFVSHWSRSSCKALSWWTEAATFLVLVFREEEVEVGVEVEVDVNVEPEPLNGLFEIPSTLSLITVPLIWDKSSDEKKLFIELSLPFADEALELGRDILCGTIDDIREPSLTLEIKRACVYVGDKTVLFLMTGEMWKPKDFMCIYLKGRKYIVAGLPVYIQTFASHGECINTALKLCDILNL